MSDSARAGEPPVLETERLLLAGHRIEDFAELAATWAEPAVVEHIFGGEPSAPRDSWMRLLAYRGLWPLLGFGYWAVRDKATGRYLGDLGFADFHRLIEPSIKGIPEAGWVLSTRAHGRGIATEALAAALAWLWAQGHDRSVCLVAPQNRASLRVAEKAGYRDPVILKMNGEDTLLLTCRRPIPRPR
ncbi:MAG: GNAT family N-acetyltransferase [Dongiaceae bacterium]